MSQRRHQPSYSTETLKNFIAVEGLDGAGTTTQSEALLRSIRAAGQQAVLTAEPSNGPVGQLVRSILKGRLKTADQQRHTDQLLAHLFAADRHDHLYNNTDGIIDWLNESRIVITTRYYFSSYAYNARTAEEFALVDRLNCAFPLPEVVVYLYQTPDVSLERIKDRGHFELYEKEDELLRVAKNFDEILEPIRDRVVFVNAVGDPKEIAAKVFDGVSQKLTAFKGC